MRPATSRYTLGGGHELGSPHRHGRENLAPGRAVRLLGISASALQTGGWQESLFDRVKGPSWEKLYRGIDDLRRKYSAESIGAATPRLRAG